ncbi:copper chaperone PCu(A)C [Fretibacter rubidus]|uniref:copper chaperone PCu(A)C n=1 Tax=Fretibacter rubidus TaxID=570162 RepID=UPI00352B1B0F
MKTTFKILLATAAVSLMACGADPSVMDGYKSDAPKSTEVAVTQSGHAVEVSGAVINPPFTGRTTSAGFMTLQNKGDDARLIAASSPISETVEIHTHLKEDGVMKMRRIDGIDIPSGQTVVLEPGGYHLMMFNTTLADDAVDAPVTLTYADGTEVTMIVPIDGRGEEMDHSQMDHSKMDDGKKKDDHSGH